MSTTQIRASASVTFQCEPHPRLCAVPVGRVRGGTTNKHSVGLAPIGKDFDRCSIHQDAKLQPFITERDWHGTFRSDQHLRRGLIYIYSSPPILIKTGKTGPLPTKTGQRLVGKRRHPIPIHERCYVLRGQVALISACAPQHRARVKHGAFGIKRKRRGAQWLPLLWTAASSS